MLSSVPSVSSVPISVSFFNFSLLLRTFLFGFSLLPFFLPFFFLDFPFVLYIYFIVFTVTQRISPIYLSSLSSTKSSATTSLTCKYIIQYIKLKHTKHTGNTIREYLSISDGVMPNNLFMSCWMRRKREGFSIN